MDWEPIGIGISVGFALVGFNGWVMKLVIDNAIGKNMLIIMDKFVTQADFDKHIEHCPHKAK